MVPQRIMEPLLAITTPCHQQPMVTERVIPRPSRSLSPLMISLASVRYQIFGRQLLPQTMVEGLLLLL